MAKLVRVFGFWLIAVYLALLIFVDFQQINAQDPGIGLEPESDDWYPEPTHRPKPRFNRFNRWMTVINEFFTEGNWSNGGPDNLLTYIGRTLSRLLDILFNRSSDSPPIPDSVFNSISSISDSLGLDRKNSKKGTNVPSSFDMDSALPPATLGSGNSATNIGRDEVADLGPQEAPTVISADMIQTTREMSGKKNFNMADIQKMMAIAKQLQKINNQNKQAPATDPAS